MTIPRVRRTQEERSATTRSALLDATFDAIVELGYRGATTTEVARRAGVSLGALLHHFPTKADLLAAGVEHAFDRRQSEFREAMGNLDASDKLGAAVDLLWSMFSGPTFVACSELWIASRTDPDLARCVAEVDRRFMATSKQLYADLFAAENAAAADTYPQVGLHLVFALLDGLAMSQLVPGYTPHPAAEVIEAFKGMVQLTTAALQPAGSTT